ncbi:MAG: hypothetical protein KAS72_12255 [Phycisphaerales bacterium]|nr:hypothetical protein [Phycisphaerales bacterium]
MEQQPPQSPQPPHGVTGKRPPATLPAKPRRVRHGLRLAAKSGPVASSWVGLAWMARFEHVDDGAHLAEGLQYARAGQTVRMAITDHGVAASVMGRAPKAYEVSINVTAFDHATWDHVISTMSDQAIYAAKLLAGQLPDSVEGIFALTGKRLLPEEDDLEVRCTCDEKDTYCKHVICAAAMIAERLDSDPFLLFTLRGLDGDVFLERLRQRRALASEQGEPAPAYTPSPPVGVVAAAPPIELCIDDFWGAGPGLDELDVEPGPPDVDHALLRRLGPAPFADARFPLVGLLATCYDTISRRGLELLSEAEIETVSDTVF